MPPGTQIDTVLKVHDKGLPEFNSDEFGDLNIRLQIHTREKLTPEERKLYEKLQNMEKSK